MNRKSSKFVRLFPLALNPRLRWGERAAATLCVIPTIQKSKCGRHPKVYYKEAQHELLHFALGLLFDEMDVHSKRGFICNIRGQTKVCNGLCKSRLQYFPVNHLFCNCCLQRVYSFIPGMMMDLPESQKVLQHFGRCHICEFDVNQCTTDLSLTKQVRGFYELPSRHHLLLMGRPICRMVCLFNVF